jgi:hypothetical protein
MKYFGDWADHADMVGDFTEYGKPAPKDLATDREVLFACYTYEDYSGFATVIFKRDGKLFEVSGSHCSCFGLEGQWLPQPVTWAALALRPDSSYRPPEANEYLRKLVKKHAAGSRK